MSSPHYEYEEKQRELKQEALDENLLELGIAVERLLAIWEKRKKIDEYKYL